MAIENAPQVAKALADASRLRILGALSFGPLCAEDIASRIGLAASTVSFHLKKLKEAGFLVAEKSQYYTVYRLKEGVLQLTVGELVGSVPGMPDDQLEQERWRAKVVRTFFSEGRLLKMPAQRRKRLVVLEQLAAHFEPGVKFDEARVTDIVQPVFQDYCLIRRMLVDEGFLSRADGWYRRTAKPVPPPVIEPTASASDRVTTSEVEMNPDQKTLKQEYREAGTSAGIFRVSNKVSGKFLIGSALNVRASVNRIEFELTHGANRNEPLQDDFDREGRANFQIEVLEEIKPSRDPEFSMERELEKLEEKYRPAIDREKTYNATEHLRFPGKAALRVPR